MTKADSMAIFEAYKKWNNSNKELTKDLGITSRMVLASCWLSAFEAGMKYQAKKRGRAKK